MYDPINIPQLRKLATDESYAPPAVFANACGSAADALEDLAKQIDGTVKVAADALNDVKRLKAALQKIADLVDGEAGEPLDEAIEIAQQALL